MDAPGAAATTRHTHTHPPPRALAGDILISINPYKRIEGLYTIPDPLPDYKEHRVPHVFAVAERAYRMMLEEGNPSKKNQSLIVSGESGAGKTEVRGRAAVGLGASGGFAPPAASQERVHAHPAAAADACPAAHPMLTSISTLRLLAARLNVRSLSHLTLPAHPQACKHIMRYLATLSERYCEHKLKRLSVAASAVSVEKKVLDCNPFLEAFGNAKTVRAPGGAAQGRGGRGWVPTKRTVGVLTGGS
jgi:hypothetical protein